MRAVPVWSLAAVLLPLAYGVTCVVGCSSAADFPVDDASGTGGDNGSTEEDGGATEDGGEAAAQDAASEVHSGACNNLQPGESFVSPNDTGTATSPAAEGGTLVSGAYHLVSTDYYPSRLCARDPVATTLVVEAASDSAGTLQLGTAVLGGTTLTESIRYISAGTYLTTRIDCFSSDPGGVQGSAAIISYSATATEVRLLTHAPGCGFSVDSYQM